MKLPVILERDESGMMAAECVGRLWAALDVSLGSRVLGRGRRTG
jgi:hypothetical protein